MKLTFKRAERLKSKKVIGEIFSNGRVIGSYPIKLFWIENDFINDNPIQFGVSVSKRKFKRAVDRNRIKRLMREAIRLNKNELIDKKEIKNKQFALMFLYVGDVLPNYETIENKIIKSIERFKSDAL